MVRGYVDTPAGQIHYREAGSGLPIVLLHQAPSSSAMMQPLLVPLAARGYRAVAFDLPGHGMSDAPAHPPEIADYAASVLAAASALGIERFNGFGHHLGASVLLQAALDQPGRIGRLVGYGLALLEDAARWDLAEEVTPHYDESGADLMTWWRNVWTHVGPELGPGVAPRTIADLLLAGVNRHYGHRAVGRCDHRGLVTALTVPMLALAGSKEALRRETEAAAGLSSWLCFEEFADAGIFVIDERPDELAARIDSYLRAAEPAAPGR